MKMLITMVALALAPGFAAADQVIPANQDSLANTLAPSIAGDSSSSANAPSGNTPSSNFGSTVSHEAQSFKASEQEKGENFGSWVSEQREHSEGHEHDRADQDTDDAVSNNNGTGSSSSPSGAEFWPGTSQTGTVSAGTSTGGSRPDQISHGSAHHDD